MLALPLVSQDAARGSQSDSDEESKAETQQSSHLDLGATPVQHWLDA